MQMLDEQYEQSLEASIQEDCLRDFVEAAWHVIEPTTVFIPGRHIDAICEHLEAIVSGEIKKLIINVPPRHMKSLLVAVFLPAWLWISQPATRLLYASYAYALSVRDSVKSRRLMQSNWYRDRWGDRYSFAGDQNEKAKYENDKTGSRMSTSVQGVATGEGGDYLIIDDPHKADEVWSDVKREGVLDWWREVWSTRKNDPAESSEIIIMQRLHERDLTGYILGEVGGYEHLVLPARHDQDLHSVTGIGFEDWRHDEELLWPDKFGEAELTEIESKLGEVGTAGQLGQRPVPKGGNIIKHDWLIYYDELPALHLFDSFAQSWDMRFGDKKTQGSYVVGLVWGRIRHKMYLLALARGRWSFDESCAEVERITVHWPQAQIKYVEDKANGPAIMNHLQDKVGGFIPVTPKGSKIARLIGVAPLFQAGDVILPNPKIYPWVRGFINEVTKYPGSAYDDQVDATSQLLSIWARSSGGAAASSPVPRPQMQM